MHQSHKVSLFQLDARLIHKIAFQTVKQWYAIRLSLVCIVSNNWKSICFVEALLQLTVPLGAKTVLRRVFLYFGCFRISLLCRGLVTAVYLGAKSYIGCVHISIAN